MKYLFISLLLLANTAHANVIPKGLKVSAYPFQVKSIPNGLKIKFELYHPFHELFPRMFSPIGVALKWSIQTACLKTDAGNELHVTVGAVTKHALHSIYSESFTVEYEHKSVRLKNNSLCDGDGYQKIWVNGKDFTSSLSAL